ncbi:MAG: Hsp33 family molecular chaperone HslO [Neisseriaceae bacterium]|nr:Hsp33 family molecular chaperone HslO [Neisseriaceae bacterium]
MKLLAETLKDEELSKLSLEEILHRLFHEFDITIYDSESYEFMCQCSQEKTEKMLLLLGEEVKDILLEQGSIQFNCGFCGKNYVFDAEDVNEIFEFDVLEENRH